MKRVIAAMVIFATLAAVQPAEAGVKSGLKKAAVKVGHVFENVLYVAVGVGAFILVCKSGACD